MKKEPVAKLHGSEKSMILGRLARAGKACPKCADAGLPDRASEEVQSQDALKGRFSATKSFTIGSIVLWFLYLYQAAISPFVGHCCRFFPTCSDYAIEAVKKYGIFKGLWLAVRRICRCHPFHRGGHDPIP